MDIYGTGGSILSNLKLLLVRLPGLKRVELGDLQLDIADGMYLYHIPMIKNDA